MHPDIREIFEPLRLAVIAWDLDDHDVFCLIGTAALDTPRVASAYALHMRDFIQENLEREFSWSEAVAEIYRRTFFDIEHAKKYGTEELAQRGNDSLKEFVTYLTTSMQMDAAVMGSTSPTEHSSASH